MDSRPLSLLSTDLHHVITVTTPESTSIALINLLLTRRHKKDIIYISPKGVSTYKVDTQNQTRKKKKKKNKEAGINP